MSEKTFFANTDLGYWIQTVVYFFAGLGAVSAAWVAFRQLSSLKKQIATSEEHAAEQIRLIRQQMEFAEASSNRHLEAVKEQMESDSKMARLRATVDVARVEIADKELLEAFELYATLREGGTEKMAALARTHPEPIKDNSALIRVLNNYEYIAVGIKTGAFDKELYKNLKQSIVVRDWEALKPYVKVLRIRYKRPKIGKELECLAKEWSTSE